MRNFIAAWLFVCLPILSFAHDSKPVVNGKTGELLDRFMQYTTRFKDGFHGTVLVAKRGEVLLEQGYGSFDASENKRMPHDAVMDIASVTKQFTAAAILKLEMQGKLKLDDPLKKFYPHVGEDKADVTLRRLLNHTSGLPNTAGFAQAGIDIFDRTAVENYIIKLPMASEPGTDWVYNNIAYFLLGAIVEHASGITWEEYLRENFFEPAGMKDTSCLGEADLKKSRIPKSTSGTKSPFPYGPRNAWGYRGAGGVHSTVRDMLLWDIALRGDGILNDDAKRKFYATDLNHYALGWNVDVKEGKRKVDHTGSLPGFCCQYTRCLEDDIVIVVLTNMHQARRGPPEFTNALLEIVETGIAKIPAEPMRSLDSSAVRESEGKYRLANGGMIEVRRTSAGGIVVGALDPQGVNGLRAAAEITGIGHYRGPIINEKLNEVLTDLAKKDRTKYDKLFVPYVDARLREQWLQLLLQEGTGKGSFKRVTITGHYAASPNISNQFIRLEFEKGTVNLLVVWDATRVHAIAPCADYPASFTFQNAGNDGFIALEADTWKAPWLQFERNQNRAVEKLTISGFRKPIVATRTVNEEVR